ncbi:MAG: hypothetical protein ABSF81_17235 [Bacteroidales bacterium]|jgi:hypothetical protein
MIRFIITAILTGLLFGILDGLINGNPWATKLMECYKPIAKQSINIPAGLIIDLVYGFAISGLFLLLFPVLPTEFRIIKGITFGVGMWFFRVLMNVISSWMMFNIPGKTLDYLLLSGLIEMILLGILSGLMLKR